MATYPPSNWSVDRPQSGSRSFESSRALVNDLSLPVSVGRTTALRDFRMRSGHTTQYLLTLIVGTEAVRRGYEAPSGLPASWNPKSREDAAGRARTFALQAATVWNAESVIGYVSSITKSRPALVSEILVNEVNGIRAREDKLVALCAGVEHPRTTSLSLVRAAMVWRNKLTHVHASNRLAQDVVASLHSCQDSIAEEYQGLKVTELIERIHDGAPPRLKEATALMRASSALTRSLDERICAQIEVGRYLDEVLRLYLAPRELRVARATGLWGGTPTQNRRAILNVAAQAGVRTDAPDSIDSDLPSLTPKVAVARLNVAWS